MTLRQIGEYVTAVQKQEEQQFIERAILLDGLHQQIISVLKAKRPAVLTLDKLYPQFFDEKVWFRNLSKEQKAQVEAAKWAEFLGL